ncbi:nuclease A inhibitor family protein [Fibrella aestuarina BUZ 2]|uniref:Nuclease A inhibitor family protein n=1 Tax=Fibrella aestuarina BUZ 2 TaxID=1166018 RepID=I0KDQ4_9BACT|nr:nuclease A inhibitor family protein [Fibrella aestuarina]CCH02257.1 nuclease A inhibitor family protein [Fibrella aestuarina BUZ 2]
MTNPSADSNAPDDQKPATDFATQVTPLLTDLLYPSESDEPIEVVDTYLKMAEPLTVSHIKDWLMLPPSVYVEEMPEADFWVPVTTIEAWFGDDEKAQAHQFQQLKETLEKLLTDRQVFRVGDTEIDVYLLGKPAEGPRVGLKTKVVET